MTRPLAVLFDCDGVIVDSEPVAARIAYEDLKARGLTVSHAEFEKIFTGSTMYVVRDKARAAGLDLADDWTSGIYKAIYADLTKGVDLVPGVLAVLDALDAAGIPYGVGSNGQLVKMDITLGQHAGLKERFNGHIYSGQELGATKPDPLVYLHGAKQLGIAPHDCVVVDDSIYGCMAGVAAGMRTMGFAAHGDGADLKSVGAEVFHHMDELPGLLGL